MCLDLPTGGDTDRASTATEIRQPRCIANCHQISSLWLSLSYCGKKEKKKKKQWSDLCTARTNQMRWTLAKKKKKRGGLFIELQLFNNSLNLKKKIKIIMNDYWEKKVFKLNGWKNQPTPFYPKLYILVVSESLRRALTSEWPTCRHVPFCVILFELISPGCPSFCLISP